MKERAEQAQFVIKVPKELKDVFFDICHANDRHASQVLRDLMREYTAKHAQGRLKLK